MSEPRWIGVASCLAIHDRLLAIDGGQAGIRDPGLLESALERPRNKFLYEASDIFTLAATLADGLVNNHPFNDGNKRIGFLCSAVSLEKNGFCLIADEAQATIVFLELARGEIDVETLANWFKENSKASAE